MESLTLIHRSIDYLQNTEITPRPIIANPPYTTGITPIAFAPTDIAMPDRIIIASPMRL
jgi:hypothetical protein